MQQFSRVIQLGFSVSLLATAVLAQAKPVESLLDPDWQRRNAAAAALAAAPELPIEALLRVLVTDNQMGEIGPGRFGGRPGPPREIVERILRTSREALSSSSLRRFWLQDYFPLTDASGLVVPRSPRQLASWLLRSRPDQQSAVAAGWRTLGLEPADRERARVWLFAIAPTLPAVLETAKNATCRQAIVEACVDAHESMLIGLAEQGELETRDEALLCAQESWLDSPTPLALVAKTFLTTTDQRLCRHLGSILEARGGIAIQALATESWTTLESRRRASGLAALIGSKAEVPIAPLRRLLDDEDDEVVARTLCAFSRATGSEPECTELAGALLARLQNEQDPDRGALTLHAIGALGTAIDAPGREQLKKLWADRRPGSQRRAPLLATLAKLGLAADIDAQTCFDSLFATNVTAANLTVFAVAAAATGDGGAAILNRRRDWSRDGELPRIAVAIADRNPRCLASWLEHPRLRQAALEALAANAPDHLPAIADLLTWTTDRDEGLGAVALAAAVAHPEASQHTELLLQRFGGQPSRYFAKATVEWLRTNSPTLPAESRTAALAPRLAAGQSWELLDDLPAAILAPHLRRWLDEADVGTRPVLWNRLLRLGLAVPEDLAAMAAHLRSNSSGGLSVVENLTTLPPELRTAIADRITIELDSKHELAEAGAHGCAEILWRHRIR